MNDKDKRIRELLLSIREKHKEMGRHGHKIEKLEADEQGRLILDPHNPKHMAWLYNDGEYHDSYDEMMKAVWKTVNAEQDKE